MTTLQQWADQLRAEAGGKIQQRLRVQMTELALDGAGEARDLIVARFERGGVRTGRLHKSLAGVARERGGTLEAVVSAGGRTGGADVRYARPHEEGAIIRPKRGKFLAIPMPAALTGAGVARGGPRDFPNLRFQPGRDGSTAWLVQESGRGKTSRSVLMFKLVRRVEIKGKHYLRDGMQAALGRLPAPMQAALSAAVAVR